MAQKYSTGYVVVDSDPNTISNLQQTAHQIKLAIHEDGSKVWRFVPLNSASTRWVLLNVEGNANTLNNLSSNDFVRKTGTITETITGTKTFSDETIIPKFQIYRSINTNSGISWFNPSYKAWQNYMSNSGVTTCGVNGNVTAPSGELVTSWALRSFVENNNGYGWTFESGSNSAGTPSVVAEIKSIDGSARFLGDLTSEGTFISKMAFNSGSWSKNIIKGNNTLGTDIFNIGLNGSGTTAQKAYIGYGDYNSINNLQITPSGHVSIGTTTNIDRLNIGGRLRVIDNDIYLGSTSVNSTTDIGIRMTEYNSTSFSGFYTSYNGNTNRYSIWSHSPNDSNIANDVRRFSIHRDTGNVLIGNLPTSAHKLDVDGDVNSDFYRSNTDSSTESITLNTTNTSAGDIKCTVSNNKVIITGTFTSSSNTSNIVIGTLPASAKPTITRYGTMYDSGTSTTAVLKLIINTNGEINVSGVAKSGESFIIDTEFTKDLSLI